MIQVYKKENANFEMNGDTTLFPTECKLSTILNSSWELTMSHPLDQEGRWKHLEEEGVISAPTFQGDKQLFRINKIVKTDTQIEVTAYPIFFDSANDCFLLDVRPEMKNGQQALDIMTKKTKYSGKSDIKHTSTAYFVRRNLMDSINGEDEPTFIQRWGGEILYNNYEIIINERVGGDYGTEIRYGKNMSEISYQLDMSGVVTRIIPVAYNGYTLEGDEPWVDSPNIKKYAMVYTKEVKFDNVKLKADASDEEEEGVIVCPDLESLRKVLKEECDKQFESGLDLPAVTIEVNMVDLSTTEEYKDYKILETVGLGDTVQCRNAKLDITTEARVIELEWDCIRNIPAEITLGDFEYNYFSELSSALTAVESIIGPGNTVVAERVQGVLNAINTQLRYQKNIAQRQDVRAILFEDLDKTSPNYGAMCLGTQGFQIADHRTADDRDWDWTTAFTAKGGYADVLITGLLSDRTGKSWWNLDTGEMQLTGVFRQFATNGYRSVDIANNQIRFYAWNDNGDYVGAAGSLKGNGNLAGRKGVGFYCGQDNFLTIGYKEDESESSVTPIIRFDIKKPNETPYIANTVADGKLFKSLKSGGITVENGLLKEWSMPTTSGVVHTEDWSLTIKDGLIESIGIK